jgi:hypothetical protein
MVALGVCELLQERLSIRGQMERQWCVGEWKTKQEVCFPLCPEVTVLE